MRAPSIFAVLIIVFALGWCLNVYKLVVYTDFASPYKAEVIRTIGVFVAPIGGILGYLTIEDK